jgi:hypothetical protein
MSLLLVLLLPPLLHLVLCQNRRPLSKGLEALLLKWGCAQDVADAVGELPRTGGSASSGRHLHACRRACMALKLHKILAPMLQVGG